MTTDDTEDAELGFDTALDFVLDHEGRICESVPGDPGGATKWGVTQEDDDEYRRQTGQVVHNVFAATEDEIDAIYQAHYWQPLQCDGMSYPVAMTLFDTGVNCGNVRAVKWLQAVLGVAQDGVLGQDTMDAGHNYVMAHGAVQLAMGVIARRRAYYTQLGAPGGKFAKFLAGWLARCDDLTQAIKAATDAG